MCSCCCIDAVVYPFLSLSSLLLCGYMTLCLSIHLLIDIWFIFSLRLLQVKLLWTFFHVPFSTLQLLEHRSICFWLSQIFPVYQNGFTSICCQHKCVEFQFSTSLPQLLSPILVTVHMPLNLNKYREDLRDCML